MGETHSVLQPLLPEEEPTEALMPLRAAPGRKPDFKGYRRLEMIVDSGAAASVMPENLLKDYKVTRGEAAQRGVHYLTADGGRVPNLGEMSVKFVTKEQFKCAMTFQVADVTKPILSVGSLAALGNIVSFTKFGGTIYNPRSKRKVAFKKRGGVYIIEVLIAPGDLQSVPVNSLPTGEAPASAGSTQGLVAPASAGPTMRAGGTQGGFTRPGM